MSKKLIALVLAIALLAVGVQAQLQAKGKLLGKLPEMTKAAAAAKPVLIAVGRGIAVSPDDSMDFHLLKFGVGRVAVKVNQTRADKVLGTISIDDNLYKLFNIEMPSDSEVSGEVYSREGEQVGSFFLTKTQKPLPAGNAEIVWVGTLEESGKTYYMYIHGQLAQPVKALKAAGDKIEEFCTAHKTDARCVALAKNVAAFCLKNPKLAECAKPIKKVADYCKNNPDKDECAKLGGKIVSFCKDNPTDARCKNVVKKVAEICKTDETRPACKEIALRAFQNCKNATASEACKAIGTQIVSYCQSNPTDEKCVAAGKRFGEYCAAHGDEEVCKAAAAKYCDAHPEDENCSSATGGEETIVAETEVTGTEATG